MGKLRNAGPGRPKGSQNKRTLFLSARIDKLVPDEKLIRLLWTLAKGERRQVLLAGHGKPRLAWVKDRGDSHAAALLAERKWGKVPQPVQGGDDGAPPVRVVLDDRLGIQYRK